jgi:hypothetical protein
MDAKARRINRSLVNFRYRDSRRIHSCARVMVLIFLAVSRILFDSIWNRQIHLSKLKVIPFGTSKEGDQSSPAGEIFLELESVVRVPPCA